MPQLALLSRVVSFGVCRLKSPPQRMESQSDEYEYDEYEDVDAYYDEGQDEMEPEDEREPDPECYEYSLLTVDEAKAFLAREVQAAAEALKVSQICSQTLDLMSSVDPWILVFQHACR